MDIKQTNQQEISALNMLVYGDPGAGKTSFLGTAKDILIADTENGLLALRDKNIPYTTINSIDDAMDLYKYLRDEKHPYKVVAIDTLSELGKKIVSEMEQKKSMVNGTGSLTLQGWGEVSKKMRNLIRAFRDLPMSVIFTAHAQFQATDETKQMRVPMLQGKLPMEVCGMVDLVGYMAVVGSGNEKKHVIFTEASDNYYAKDRTETSNGIMPPDFEQIKEATFNNTQFTWTRKLVTANNKKVAEFEKDMDTPNKSKQVKK